MSVENSQAESILYRPPSVAEIGSGIPLLPRGDVQMMVDEILVRLLTAGETTGIQT